MTKATPDTATPKTPKLTVPTIVDIKSQSAPLDWRVTLSVPDEIADGEVMKPLRVPATSPSLSGVTFNKMIFPFTPKIQLAHTANYSQIAPTHTNYVFNAYQNSKIENITITGDFVVENEEDAKYWVACLHFLRTMTKMFYGDTSANLGNPPLVSRLNGYGKHVLNNIPVLIQNFSIDLGNDIDYVPCTVDGKVNYTPTHSTITVVCMPNYARRTHSTFDLNRFARGEFVGKPEGFI